MVNEILNRVSLIGMVFCFLVVFSTHVSASGENSVIYEAVYQRIESDDGSILPIKIRVTRKDYLNTQTTQLSVSWFNLSNRTVEFTFRMFGGDVPGCPPRAVDKLSRDMSGYVNASPSEGGSYYWSGVASMPTSEFKGWKVCVYGFRY